MSQDRIVGMIWGFNIGFGLMCSIYIHPVMIVFPIFAFTASWWFAKRAVVGSVQTSGSDNG